MKQDALFLLLCVVIGTLLLMGWAPCFAVMFLLLGLLGLVVFIVVKRKE